MEQVLIIYNRRNSSIKFMKIQKQLEQQDFVFQQYSMQPSIFNFYVQHERYFDMISQCSKKEYQGQSYQVLEIEEIAERRNYDLNSQNHSQQFFARRMPQYQEPSQNQISYQEYDFKYQEKSVDLTSNQQSLRQQDVNSRRESHQQEIYSDYQSQKQSGQMTLSEGQIFYDSQYWKQRSYLNHLHGPGEQSTFNSGQNVIDPSLYVIISSDQFFNNEESYSNGLQRYVKQIIHIEEQKQTHTERFELLDNTLKKFYYNPILFEITLYQLSVLCSSLESTNWFEVFRSASIYQILSKFLKEAKDQKQKTQKELEIIKNTMECLIEFGNALNEFTSLQIIKRFKDFQTQEIQKIKAINIFKSEQVWLGDYKIQQESQSIQRQEKSKEYLRLIQIFSLLESLKQRSSFQQKSLKSIQISRSSIQSLSLINLSENFFD